MEASKLRVGSIYVVAGVGEMKLVEVGDGGVCLLVAHGGGSYWAPYGDVVREADWVDVDARQEQARSRGVECRSESCWCRRDRG